MKANELMIGDIVTFKDCQNDKKPVIIKIWSINQDGEAFAFIDNDESVDEIVIDDEIVGIPLTPEILEKNGFITEEREGDPTFPYLAFIIENNEYRIEITWYDSHDVYEPNTGEYLHGAPEVWNMEILGKYGNYDCGKKKLYVHELQHALKLCGIEKTIEL